MLPTGGKGSSKSFLRKFQGCFGEAPAMCQERFKGASSMFQGIYKSVAIVFQGGLIFLECFKLVLWVFQGSSAV